MRENAVRNRILTLLLSGIPPRWHFNIFVPGAVIAGLAAVAVGILLGTSQAHNGPANASKVAGVSPGLAVGGRPYLGMTYVSITAHMAAYYNLPASSGVLVTTVKQGSPAQKAGIQANDVVIEFDGLTLSGDATIIDVLSQREVGQNVEIGIVRNGEWRKMQITLGARPED